MCKPLCSTQTLSFSRENLTNARSTQEAWAACVAEPLAFHFHTHTNRLEQPRLPMSSASSRDSESCLFFWVTRAVLSKKTDLTIICGLCYVFILTSYQRFTAVSLSISTEYATDMKKSSGWRAVFIYSFLWYVLFHPPPNNNKGKSCHHHYWYLAKASSP